MLNDFLNSFVKESDDLFSKSISQIIIKYQSKYAEENNRETTLFNYILSDLRLIFNSHIKQTLYEQKVVRYIIEQLYKETENDKIIEEINLGEISKYNIQKYRLAKSEAQSKLLSGFLNAFAKEYDDLFTKSILQFFVKYQAKYADKNNRQTTLFKYILSVARSNFDNHYIEQKIILYIIEQLYKETENNKIIEEVTKYNSLEKYRQVQSENKSELLSDSLNPVLKKADDLQCFITSLLERRSERPLHLISSRLQQYLNTYLNNKIIQCNILDYIIKKTENIIRNTYIPDEIYESQVILYFIDKLRSQTHSYIISNLTYANKGNVFQDYVHNNNPSNPHINSLLILSEERLIVIYSKEEINSMIFTENTNQLNNLNHFIKAISGTELQYIKEFIDKCIKRFSSYEWCNNNLIEHIICSTNDKIKLFDFLTYWQKKAKEYKALLYLIELFMAKTNVDIARSKMIKFYSDNLNTINTSPNSPIGKLESPD